jgi:hypothetical protein
VFCVTHIPKTLSNWAIDIEKPAAQQMHCNLLAWCFYENARTLSRALNEEMKARVHHTHLMHLRELPTIKVTFQGCGSALFQLIQALNMRQSLPSSPIIVPIEPPASR